ncbi:PAC2 family protein [Isoptericola sp. b441]|uniref:PAC2 family protein n=1 Tax=Actinotalea lenta TaxID=3064654 RepID=A0ABT9DA13_9CELL|nr:MULTISPECIES: PAC2 family protein [unclassified Isoptericola]MDO8107410.1 PAC2 family protein [Isoptericola sp. b441]MDO8120928.1 PAC2 family protein [Isoptericola sp. b490]
MRDPDTLYTVNEEVAEQVGDAPVLVHLVRGFVDAGAAGQVAAEHLTEQFTPQRLVTFDVDELVDYRSRRPMMTFDRSTWNEYDEPELAIDLMHDREGAPFLLLHGVEPDIRWESWVAAVRRIVERFGVRLVVGVHGIPMGVPHTRPLGFTAHATRSDLVEEHPMWFGSVRVPASASALLEHRLGRWGHDAMGFAVHVPHYLAQSAYPQAAMVALGQLEKTTGLDLASGALESAAREAAAEIERQMAGSPEVASVVHALEKQYDDAVRAIDGPGLLGEDLPTADELGAEFERFLAQQEDGGEG